MDTNMTNELNDLVKTYFMSVAAKRDVEELEKAMAAGDVGHIVLYLLYLVRDIPDDDLANAVSQSAAIAASELHKAVLNNIEPSTENAVELYNKSLKPLENYISTHKKEETND